MIFHLFTLLFVGLKLMHIIDWSWWLVFLPSIFVALVAFFMLILGMIIASKIPAHRLGVYR